MHCLRRRSYGNFQKSTQWQIRADIRRQNTFIQAKTFTSKKQAEQHKDEIESSIELNVSEKTKFRLIFLAFL